MREPTVGVAMLRVLTLLFLGCAGAPCPEPTSPTSSSPAPTSHTRSSPPSSPAPASPTASSASAPPVTLTPRPDLAHHFADANLEGAFAAWRADGTGAVCVGDCETRHPCASTFKVPHALLALELGVLTGPDHELAWDGQTRAFEGWNRDHTLRTAIAESVVWYFQRLAPFIGPARMQAGLRRFAFGNAQISDPIHDQVGDDVGGERITTFWLDGTLRISPREQVAFWHRLHEDAFGVRPEARAALLDMTELARDGAHVLRGKTGWYRVEDDPENVGWLVGCVDAVDAVGEGVDERARTCFATVIRAREPLDHAAFRAARLPLSRRLLAELGVRAPE